MTMSKDSEPHTSLLTLYVDIGIGSVQFIFMCVKPGHAKLLNCEISQQNLLTTGGQRTSESVHIFLSWSLTLKFVPLTKQALLLC